MAKHSPYNYSSTMTLFCRLPPDYNSLGTDDAPSEKGLEMYDRLISEKLHDALVWCGDEILAPADFPATPGDKAWCEAFDLKAILNDAFDRLCNLDDPDLWEEN